MLRMFTMVSGTIYYLLKKKKRVVFANAFSVNMLESDDAIVRFKRIRDKSIINTIKNHIKQGKIQYYSIVGHSATAKLLSLIFDTDIAVNRENYKLKESDLLVVMVVKERLNEGEVIDEKKLRDLWVNNKIDLWLIWIRKED